MSGDGLPSLRSVRPGERVKKDRPPVLVLTLAVRKGAIVWFLAALFIGFLVGRSSLLYFGSF